MAANNFRDKTGMKFGRLTVISHAGKYRKKQTLWLCRCDCGTEKVLRSCSLTGGHIRSCGCLKGTIIPEGSTVVRAIRSNRIDHAGQRFGRLEVLSYVGPGRWLCRCDCGTEKAISGGALRSGDTRSCGCLEAENRVKHGLAASPEYCCWVAMIQRCCNPKNPGYPGYGGRGIAVCDRWKSSFPAFVEDMGPRPADGLSIDRIDNNLGYDPGNCRWSTKSEQQRNRRTNHRLEHDGKSMTVAEWSVVTGIQEETIHSRLRYRWPIVRVLTEPVRKRRA